MYRTNNCGELNMSNVGQQVTLAGWVQRTRKMGSMTFVDLRDRYGITQLVFNDEYDAALNDRAAHLGREFVIQVKGTVNERTSKNPNMPTGDIEIMVSELNILNESLTPPFTIEDNTDGGDDLRMKYRYLDLRRQAVKKNLELRHKFAFEVRNYLNEKGFLEIETPVLVNSTPEGARDFVVPSRMNPGQFYALPQSPQTLKQLLMVSGMDRYFQIVKCFRDEDLRADRQPEFTQIDCEMSFVEQEDILQMFEGMSRHLFKKILNIDIPTLPRMTWADAMKYYGSDKPDTRFEMTFVELMDVLKGTGEFSVFNEAEYIGGICAKGQAVYTRKQLCELRLEMGERMGLRPKDKYSCLWVIDFPMYEWSDEEQRLMAMHHPFTSPKPEDIPLLDTAPEKVRANAYDMVINGVEVGGGSIRIHDAQLQQKIFEILGFTPEQAQQKFGFLMNAFKYGAPPHGGLAYGLDRFVSLFAQLDSIRDCIAFPKNNSGRDVMLGAPGPLGDDQFQELQIKLDLKQ